MKKAILVHWPIDGFIRDCWLVFGRCFEHWRWLTVECCRGALYPVCFRVFILFNISHVCVCELMRGNR